MWPPVIIHHKAKKKKRKSERKIIISDKKPLQHANTRYFDALLILLKKIYLILNRWRTLFCELYPAQKTVLSQSYEPVTSAVIYVSYLSVSFSISLELLDSIAFNADIEEVAFWCFQLAGGVWQDSKGCLSVPMQFPPHRADLKRGGWGVGAGNSIAEREGCLHFFFWGVMF